MPTRYMAAVAPNKRKVMLVSNTGNDTSQFTNYTGNAVVWYEPYDNVLSSDSNSPQINEEYHMALVWGALKFAGFEQYARRYDQEKREARSNKTGKPYHIVRPTQY
jgi:hypothetical protein